MQTNLAGTYSLDRHLKWVFNTKETEPIWVLSLLLFRPRVEDLNAMVRWMIARKGLTEGNIYLFFSLMRRKDAAKSGRELHPIS